MSYAIDTNILLRSIQANDPTQAIAAKAIETILNRNETICLFPQNLYEFWVVATRPPAQNGLGLDFKNIGNEITRLKGAFELLPDNIHLYNEWERLVTRHKVSGKTAHDARIVAAMNTHKIQTLLTFNTGDFKRFQNITVVTPQDIAQSQPSQ